MPDFIQNAPALPKTRSGNNSTALETITHSPSTPPHLSPIFLFWLWWIQGKSWGGSFGRLPATRRTLATFPPWLTRRWWRCCLARDVKLQPETTSPPSLSRFPFQLCNNTGDHKLLVRRRLTVRVHSGFLYLHKWEMSSTQNHNFL